MRSSSRLRKLLRQGTEQSIVWVFLSLCCSSRRYQQSFDRKFDGVVDRKLIAGCGGRENDGARITGWC